MMKIGVSVEPYGKAANLYGEEMFQKLSSFGFSAIDYNINGTRYELYSMDDKAFTQRLSKEKAAADAAGITIHRMHGPWRSPPRDATPEDRLERMEKMQRSIEAARLLGCKYWVIHPIMPYGALDLDTEDPLKTWEVNKQYMGQLLQYAKALDVTSFEGDRLRRHILSGDCTGQESGRRCLCRSLYPAVPACQAGEPVGLSDPYKTTGRCARSTPPGLFIWRFSVPGWGLPGSGPYGRADRR